MDDGRGVGNAIETSGDGTPNRIYAFDKKTGEERWVHESDDGLMHWLVDANEVIAFSANSEVVRALDPNSGELVWSFGPSYWMQFPAMGDGVMFLGTGDIHGLQTADGEEVMYLDTGITARVGGVL